MPNQFSPDNQLTPEAVAVLQDVEPDLKALSVVDLGDTPPAPVFEPGDRITRE
jgi:hypothetical protein